MAIEAAKVGTAAAQLMEKLEAYGEDATIQNVIVVAAVDHGDGDTIHFALSEGMANYTAIGLLRQLLASFEAGG